MDYFDLQRKDNRCLIGALLVKAGQALLLTWGKSNVYYYSYFKQSNPQLSLSYNTLPIALIGLPCAILSLYSIKIAEKLGFENLIRFCAFTQLFSLIIAPYMDTYLNFIIFYLIIVAIAYSLLGFPLLNCLWSHYNKTEGKVTGILFGIFGLSTLLFLLLVTYLVNPYNQEATEYFTVGEQEYKYFAYQVASNVPFASQIAGFIAGLMSATGSLLINKNKSENSTLNIQLQILDPEYQLIQTSQVIDVDNELNVEPDIDSPNQQILIKQAIYSQQFRVLYFSYFSLTLFEITLGLNYKLYGLSKINDDRFLTFVDTIAIILASISNFYWGRLIDILEFKDLLLKLFLSLSIVCIMIPLSINISSIFFLFVYLSLSVMSKGAIVILGPGLLKIYGQKIGTHIFPIVNTSALVGFIASPITQFLLVQYIEFDGLLTVQGLVIGLAGIFIWRADIKNLDQI